MKNRKLSILAGLAVLPLLLTSCGPTGDTLHTTADDIAENIVVDANKIIIDKAGDVRSIGTITKTVYGVKEHDSPSVYLTNADKYINYKPDWNKILTDQGTEFGNYTATYRAFDGLKVVATNKENKPCGSILYDFAIGNDVAPKTGYTFAFDATVKKYQSDTDATLADLTSFGSAKLTVSIDADNSTVWYESDDITSVAQEYINYTKAFVDGLYKEDYVVKNNPDVLQYYNAHGTSYFYGHTFFLDGAQLKEANLGTYENLKLTTNKILSGATTQYFISRSNIFADGTATTDSANTLFNANNDSSVINSVYSTMAGKIEKGLAKNNMLAYQVYYSDVQLFDVDSAKTVDDFKKTDYGKATTDKIKAD